MTLLATALRYHEAGRIVLPNDATKKYPAGLANWQTVTPTTEQVKAWFSEPRQRAIGLRDVEGLDFDNKGNPSAEELYTEWYTLVAELAPDLPSRPLIERTPSGGYHVAWQCEVIAGNQKLATRPPTAEERRASPKITSITLIETRGRGGQFQVAPSPGYELLRGDWANLPSITPSERQIALDCARALTQADSRTIEQTQREQEGERPGDIYNREKGGEALALLRANGWREVRKVGNASYLCRPGKKQGISATFGFVAPNVLYVFSANAAPFEMNRAYSPFAVYTELEHGGDYKAAAKTLRPAQEVVKSSAAPAAKPVGPVEYVVQDWKGSGVTLAELQHKQFQPERWVVQDILPEGACLLAAKPKAKKSWLSLALGLGVSMGGRALGRLDVSPGRVLYLDLEGKQQRIQKRTRAILGVQHIAWPENFHIYTKWPQGDEGMTQLQGWFEAYPDTALVVIDVLGNFRRPIEKHEQPYQYDRDTVTPLNELLERYHCAGILVHHTNKARHDDVMDSISGTTGLPSAVNTMWAMGRDPNDSNITIFSMRGRDLENDDPLALSWDSYLNMHIIEGAAAEVATSAERKAVLHILADDTPRTPTEIAKELGKSVEPVKQLLRKLLNDGLVDKPAYGKYARVPKGDHSDHSDHSGISDHSAYSSEDLPKSDRERARVIGSDEGDHSSLGHQDALNGKSDRSDRYIKENARSLSNRLRAAQPRVVPFATLPTNDLTGTVRNARTDDVVLAYADAGEWAGCWVAAIEHTGRILGGYPEQDKAQRLATRHMQSLSEREGA